jgi:hypothetical protein
VHVVSVINYTGGVGKTTLTANLGAELAWRGHKVLLLDLDPQASLTFSLVPPEYWTEHLEKGHTIKTWYDATQSGGVVNLGSLVLIPNEVNRRLRGRGSQPLHLIPSHLGLPHRRRPDGRHRPRATGQAAQGAAGRRRLPLARRRTHLRVHLRRLLDSTRRGVGGQSGLHHLLRWHEQATVLSPCPAPRSCARQLLGGRERRHGVQSRRRRPDARATGRSTAALTVSSVPTTIRRFRARVAAV